METNFKGLDNLTQKANNRAELFKARFPECAELISTQFQILAEILTSFREIAADDLEKSVLIQSYRSFNCSWIAYQNIKSGFLSEGASVAVTALDSSLYMEYFISKPHLATRWLNGNEYPVQSFYKILPSVRTNQKIFLLLKECTDYGLNCTPRQLFDDSTPSFQLGGNDDIKKQFLLVKQLTKIISKVLSHLMEVFNKTTLCQHYAEKIVIIEQSVANLQNSEVKP